MPGGPRPPGRPGQEKKIYENAIPQNPRLKGDMKPRFSKFLIKKHGCMHTVYDCVYSNLPTKIPYIHRIYVCMYGFG